MNPIYKLLFLLLVIGLCGTSYAQTLMTIEGAIKLDDINSSPPVEGVIKWNPITKDFEGYDGTVWKSLTNSPAVENTTYVNSINELRALTHIEIGDIVTTTAYYDTIDGGSTTYRKIVKEPGMEDDGGFIIIGNDDSVYRMNDISAVNIKQFGAVADGELDDTDALDSYANFCVNNDKPFIIAKHESCRFQGDLDLYRFSGNTGIENIQVDGKLLGDIGTEIIVGHRSTQVKPTHFHFNYIENSVLKFQGLKNANVTVNRCSKILLYAHGDSALINSMAYNRFDLGFVEEVEIYSEGVKRGWINENHFHGTRLRRLNIEGNYNHNHNIFYNSTFEGSVNVPASVNIINGSSNVFENVRFEGLVNVSFGQQSRNNLIMRSWENNRSSSLLKDQFTYSDQGDGNQIEYAQNLTREKDVIFQLNESTHNYIIPDIIRTDTNLIIKPWKTIYETGLIELTNDVALHYKSDKDLFRILVFQYDTDKNLIETEQNNIGGNGLSFTTNLSSPNLGSYTFSVNAAERQIALFKRELVKYFKVQIMSGNLESPQEFNYCLLELNRSKKSPISIPVISPQTLLSETIPDNTGKWPDNTIVYNNSPEPSESEQPDSSEFVGWILLEDEWKGFGIINF